MTDEELISRLRAYAQIEHAAAPWGFAGEGEVMSRAADRIAALSEQLAAAQHDADEAEAYAEEVEADRKKTYEALLKVTRIHDEVEAKLAECEARLGKAVEALEPFARAAETWEPDDGDSELGARIEHPHHGLERHAEFTFGDLRRARATLAEIKGGKDDR